MAAPPKTDAKSDASKMPPCGFTVSAGKKGNVPISVEKRPKGKKVTIISNVQGSAKSLLSALSSLLGTGGTTRQESSGLHWTIEIQGDQTERVTGALTQLGCLRGIKKDAEARSDKKKVVEVQSRGGYDKFLRSGAGTHSKEMKEKDWSETFAFTPLVGAECHKWHGDWYYCRGRCQQVDFSDVWEDGSLETVEDKAFESNCKPGATSYSPSIPELNLIFRQLGMFAEAGEAVRKDREGPRTRTLAEYRNEFLMPGAKLLGEESEQRGSRRRAISSRKRLDDGPRVAPLSRRSHSTEPTRRDASRPLRKPPPPPKPPPQQGIHQCSICNSVFGLARTLRLHYRNAHPGEKVVRATDIRAPDKISSYRPTASIRNGPTGLGYGWRNRQPRPSATESPYTPPASSAASGSSSKCACGYQCPEYASFCKKCGVSRLHGLLETFAEQHQATNGKVGRDRPKTTSCPVCLEMFTSDDIEAHVEVCLQAVDDDEVSEEDDHSAETFFKARKEASERRRLGKSFGGVEPEQTPDFSPPCLCRVIETFIPEGAGADIQLAVYEGHQLLMEWFQPPEEGGYWAYCKDLASPTQLGYVPVSCLTAKSISSRSVDTGQTDEESRLGANRQALDDGVIPEDWLETFLLLDLPEEVAASFWHQLERLQEDNPLDVAWLQALSSVCNVMEIRPQTTKSNPVVNAQPTKPSPHKPVSTTPASTQSTTKPSPHKPRPSATSPTPSPRPAAAPTTMAHGCESGRAVIKTWEPTGDGSDIQIKVVMGDLAVIEWEQPSGEGGYWAYGKILGGPDANDRGPGYFPLDCIAPSSAVAADANLSLKTTTAVASSDRVKACSSTSGIAKNKGNIGSLGTSVSRGGKACQFGRGAGDAGRVGRGGKASSKSTAVKRDTCPWCGLVVPMSRLEDHAERCRANAERSTPAENTVAGADTAADQASLADKEIRETRDKAEASQGEKATTRSSVEAAACQIDPGTSDLSEEVASWAQAQLSKLAERFCKTKIDPAVALAALSVCGTSADMCTEAVSLFGDNRIVRNFAAELWQRRGRGEARRSSTHELACGGSASAAGQASLVDVEIRETHDRAEASQSDKAITKPSVKASACQIDPDTSDLSEEVASWAQAKLSKLAERFCQTKIDPAVAFAALSVCGTSADMCIEAMSLFGDNHIVRNFAAELWQKRGRGEAQCSSTHELACGGSASSFERTGRWRGRARLTA